MINFIIVDDEPIAHRIIENFAKDIPYLNLRVNCHNAMQAMEYLNKESIDLIFLDINMPKIKGLDFLKMINNPPAIIITTAYEEYALEGFELSVTDYLLKPFSFERFFKAVNKVSEQKKVVQVEVTAPETVQETIFIKGDKKHHQIVLNEILYIESIGSYCKIILQEESVITHEKISGFEKLLSKEQFLRVHKSFIVARKYIKTIEGNRIFLADHVIPIGQTYKLNINKLLDN